MSKNNPSKDDPKPRQSSADDTGSTSFADDDESTTIQMQSALDRLNAGDRSAKDDVIAVANDRLTKLSRAIFRGEFGSLGDTEGTVDVWHEAFFKLHKALDEIFPATPREFFGLAARNIRWTLLDMVRKAQGRKPKEDAGDSAAKPPRRPKTFLDGGAGDGILGQVADGDSIDPVDLVAWTEFHEAVQGLTKKYREVFDLVYYQGLTQQKVADTIGINVRTVKRYWLSAKLELVRKLDGRMPNI